LASEYLKLHVRFRLGIDDKKGDHEMSDKGSEILREALSLPAGERAELAERLLSSLDAPDRQRLDELWAREAEDRLGAYEKGEITTIPVKQAFDQIGRKTK